MPRTAPVPVLALLVLLASRAAAAEPFIPDDANSWAWPTDAGDPAAPSPIDLRHLSEEVAGAKGPLRPSADGNGLVLADGTPFRAWMVHLPNGVARHGDADDWKESDYRRSARFLARLGVNLGIIGVPDPSQGADPLKLKPGVIPYTHRAVAAAKAAGIYTQLRVAWFAGVQGARLGVAGHEDRDTQCLIWFHPRAQEAWKAWTRALLTTPDATTGIALKDEPALCSLEVANEDSLLFYVTDRIAGEARHELERRFHDWCVKRHGSAEAALAAWHGARDKADAPAEGRLGILIAWFMTRDGRGKADEQRVRDQLAFLIETSQAWQAEAKRFVHEELGAKHLLIAASNFVPADRVVLDDALRLMAWRDADVIENNHYVEHDGAAGPEGGWRVTVGDRLGLRSAVADPFALPTGKRQAEGKPFWITETLWPRPHPYEVEGPLLVAAYQSLTGVDGLAWAGPRDATWDGPRLSLPWLTKDGHTPFYRWGCSGPQTLGQFPAAAAIVRLGLVEPGPTVVAETRTAAQIIAREEPATAETFAFDPNQFAAGQTQDTTVRGGVPPEAFLVGRVSVRLAERAEPPKVADLKPFLSDGVVTSATRQLRMDARRRLFTLDAPAAQAVVGFLRDAGEVKLSGATIACPLEHGTVAVVALDAKPLAASRRILVQVGARAVLTGWRESAATIERKGQPKAPALRIDATGSLPWRVRRASGTVALPRAAVRKATALDGNGLPRGEVVLERVGEGVRLALPADAAYVVLE